MGICRLSGGITCIMNTYRATGFVSLRPAQTRVGRATAVNNQKLGLRNAATVNAIQTLRLRMKSSFAVKRRQIGLAIANTGIAITKTTIKAFRLASIGAKQLTNRLNVPSPPKEIRHAFGQ